MSRIVFLLACIAVTGCAHHRGRMDALFRGDREAAAEAGQDYSSRMARAQQAVEQRKLDEARTIYQGLIVEFPTRFEPYQLLGHTADAQRRHHEAQALYAEAIRLAPQRAELFNDLGYSYYLDGQLEKAQSALLKATAAEPANARYRNNLGLTYGAQGKLSEALEEFRRSGSEADAQYNLAFILAVRNDTEGAKRAFRLAMAADPRHPQALAALRSFEAYERQPPELASDSTDEVPGTRWVPFVEGSPDGGASAGLANLPAGSTGVVGADTSEPAGASGQSALSLPVGTVNR